MTTTEDTAAADALAAGVAELAGTLGPKRAAALAMMGRARLLHDAAGVMLVQADLADLAAPAGEALARAQERREAAEEAIAPVQATIDRLAAELADCRGRAGNIDQVIDTDADLTSRIEARSLRLAFAEEQADLTGRIDMIRRGLLTTLQADLTEARGAEDRARTAGAALVDAAESPLTHPAARRTEGYGVWLQGRALEILAAGDHRAAGWAEARGELMSLLRSSGIGAEIETKAIQAFRSGDPAAVSVGGTTTHLPSGDTVVYDPSTGRPPVVMSGRATAQQLAAAPAAPQADTRPAASVLSQAWAGIQHQTTAGLYVHP